MSAALHPIAIPPELRTPVESWLAAYQRLSPADMQSVLVGLEKTLGTSVLTAYDEYKVPGIYDLVIFGITAYVRLPNLASEPVPPLYAWVPATDRIVMKAQNCIFRLADQERKAASITDNRDPPLSAFMQPFGAPAAFPGSTPLMVPAAHTLRSTFTLVSSTASVVGADSIYGIYLNGILVPAVKGEGRR